MYIQKDIEDIRITQVNKAQASTYFHCGPEQTMTHDTYIEGGTVAEWVRALDW